MRYSENLGSTVDKIKDKDSVNVKRTKELINKYSHLSAYGERTSYNYKKEVVNINNDLRTYFMKMELLNNEFPDSLKLTRNEREFVKQFLKDYIRLFHTLNSNLRTDQIILCFMLLAVELFGEKQWDFRIKVCRKYKLNAKNYKRFLTNLLRLKLYSTQMKPIEIGEEKLTVSD